MNSNVRIEVQDMNNTAPRPLLTYLQLRQDGEIMASYFTSSVDHRRYDGGSWCSEKFKSTVADIWMTISEKDRCGRSMVDILHDFGSDGAILLVFGHYAKVLAKSLEELPTLVNDGTIYPENIVDLIEYKYVMDYLDDYLGRD